ncbi:MAG: serpin family protein, partial [Planctomycetia bacterium]|nr:serpin family protein [Planctomycetia bacterium]
MKWMLTAVLLGALTCSLLAKAPQETAEAKKQAQEDVGRMVNSNNAFAWSLYAKLAEKEGNLFFSPSSIHTALAMTYAGARGKTGLQMHLTLRLPYEDLPPAGGKRYAPAMMPLDEITPWPQGRVHPAYAGLLKELKPGKKAGYQLHVANALWGQKGEPWLKEFLATTKDNYGAGLREVDFKGQTEAARQTINKWVEKQTKEKIKDLLAKRILTPLTRLVLTNAIYCKGDWARQFDKKRTKDRPFKLSADKSVKVPMMNQTAKFGYAETKDLQVLRMAYVGKELSMVVLLPRKVGGLAEVEKSLAKTGLNDVLKNLRQQEAHVCVPQFKIES